MSSMRSPWQAQAGLERRERLVVARPGVDQRDRVACRSHAFTDPTCGQWKGMATAASMN